VLGRSEFGMEIVVEIAYLVYVLGLSFDKACLTLRFLQNLHVGKTQADRLLHQLARHGQDEFDILCTLLANSLGSCQFCAQGGVAGSYPVDC